MTSPKKRANRIVPKQSDKNTFVFSDFKVPFITATIALALNPFSIYLGFRLNDYLSRPNLSIEYVSQYREPNLLDDSLIPRIEAIASNTLYLDYVSETPYTQRGFDLRNLPVIGSDYNPPDLAQKVRNSLNGLLGYLSSQSKAADSRLSKLDNISVTELRILAFSVLDRPPGVNNHKIKQLPREHYEHRLEQIKKAQGIIYSLIKSLDKPFGVIKLKISILNKGSTDGLIRNQDEIIFDKKHYAIYRVPDPSGENYANAVPTFMVNAPPTQYDEHSVGQVVKLILPPNLGHPVKQRGPAQIAPG